MPPHHVKVELPEDVWREIMENHMPFENRAWWSSYYSLSLTCRRLREITVPAVFHSLTFDLNQQGTQPRGLPAMRRVLRAEFRANCLEQCPYLLQHVREVTLSSWDPTILTPVEPDEQDTPRALPSGTREEWWWAAYDIVTGLPSQMPALRKLTVLKSAVTPRLHKSAVCHPDLESLVLSPDNSYQYCDSLPPSNFLMSIRHLDLLALDLWGDSSLQPDYFEHILRYCLTNLISLKIYYPHLPCYQEPLSAAPDLSSLQYLTLEIPDPEGYEDFVPLNNMFKLFKGLHSLEFVSEFILSDDDSGAEIILRDLPEDALPELRSASGPPELLKLVIPGRPVNTIRLVVEEPELLASFDLPVSTISQVCHLEIKGDAYSHDDMYTIIRFIGHFTNLTHLNIAMAFFERGEPSDWVDEELEEWEKVLDTLLHALSHLPRLRHCRVFERNASVEVGDEIPLEREVCPIGEEYNPDDRGHPSLELILLFGCFIWRWFPGEGWTPEILSHSADK